MRGENLILVFVLFSFSYRLTSNQHDLIKYLAPVINPIVRQSFLLVLETVHFERKSLEFTVGLKFKMGNLELQAFAVWAKTCSRVDATFVFAKSSEDL